MKLRIAVLVASLVVLGLLGVAGARSASQGWEEHQRRYLEESASKRGSQAGEPQALEIRQDRLQGVGELRLDRCRSCHAAVDDPSFTAGKQPLHTHPSITPHNFNEIGCTSCHEGDGRAVTEELAHGADPFWPEPILRGAFVESSCARCHPEPYLAQTPHLKRGRALFEGYACVGCHTVQGLSRGNIGLELTDVGNKRKVDFFLKKLENPRFNQPMTLMPSFRIPEQDRNDLAVFLKSLRGKPLSVSAFTERDTLKRWRSQVPPPMDPSVEAGQKAVETRGCTSCHKLGDKDGGLAPDLSYLGQIRDAQYVVAHLTDPRAHTPGSSMPNFWMSDGERQAIAAYLMTLQGYTAPGVAADQYVQMCARCHGEKGGGNGPVSENLLPRPRVFSNIKFFNWLPEDRAYKAIREGVPGTAMPAFGKVLDDAQTKALFAHIRSSYIGERQEPPKRNVPAASPVAYSEESVKRGKAAFLERCYGCHGRAGDGKGPNAPEMLPRPRNLSNHYFFAGLPDARLFESITYGIVGTGMPPWDYLPDNQRWDLVNYVRHLSSTGAASSQKRSK